MRKSHRHIVIIIALALTGCASGGSTHMSRSSDTQTVRDVNGTTQYRIRDSSVFTPNGTRVARIDSSGNIFNTSGGRVGTISKK
jgi:outer membrane lipoprotein SlyB